MKDIETLQMKINIMSSTARNTTINHFNPKLSQKQTNNRKYKVS